MARKEGQGDREAEPGTQQDAEKESQEAGVNWEAIHAEYIAGKIGYKELAKKYQISFSTLSKKATKEQWVKDRRKVGEKVAKKMTTRAARAREEKALKGINLAKYITDLWTDNLKTLNMLIQKSPEKMLENPSFAASLPKGVRETYQLIMEINGRGYMNRKLANEEKKIRIEREKLELEKIKWEAQKAAMERGIGTGAEAGWVIEEDTDDAGVDIGG